MTVLYEGMDVGGTAFLVQDGGKYPDGLTMMIFTKFKEGLGVTMHFHKRSSAIKLRDQLIEYLDA